MEKWLCPRRDEIGVRLAKDEGDSWRKRGGEYGEIAQCSYCGSMHPDDFMRLAESGAWLTPTDKTYKVYATMPNGLAGKLVSVGSTSHPTAEDVTSGRWVVGRDLRPEEREAALRTWSEVNPHSGYCFSVAPECAEGKFYFQHLSGEQRQRFVELINEGKLRLRNPGHFYVLPFFCVPALAVRKES